MKQVKKIVSALLLAALIFTLPATAAFASENGSLWLSTTETSDSTTVYIVADTTVTDGVVEVTYDSSVLTYQNVITNEIYVAMFSVNAENPGTVKISWVAPEPYENDGSAISLIQLNFSGTEKKSSVELTGTGNSLSGSVSIANGPDTTELKKNILVAVGLNEYVFTADSFAAVKEALTAAKEVLNDPTSSQKDIDDACNALKAAIDGLKLISSVSNGNVDTSALEISIAKAEGLNEDLYTKESFKALEKALKSAKAVLSDRNATQAEVDAAAKALNDAIAALELLSDVNPNTGSESVMGVIIAIAAVSAAGMAIMGMNIKRRRAI